MSACDRQRSAVTAAVAGAGSLGLPVSDPRVLYDVFSVVVHLAPSPVVARVPTVLARSVLTDRSAQVRQMRMELAATDWLAGTGFPCVRPAHSEPLMADGHAMTLWELVDQVQDPVAEETAGAGVARLHAALADCPVALDWLVPLDASVPDSLVQLHDQRPGYLTTADVDRALAEWAVLQPWASDPVVHATTFPGAPAQPTHGDAPFYNVIATSSGVLSSDFEHVGLAPAEWDLVGAPEGVRAGYERAAARSGLRELDRQVLALCERGRLHQLLAVFALADAVPGMVQALEPLITTWRASAVLVDLTSA